MMSPKSESKRLSHVNQSRRSAEYTKSDYVGEQKNRLRTSYDKQNFDVISAAT